MEDEDWSVTKAGQRYVEDTTTGGVKRAARPGIIVKVFWALAFVIGTAMTIYCYYRLIRLYSDYQKGTVQRLDDVRTQDFPAVTFCNVNPITSSGCYSSSGDVQQLYDIYEQYMPNRSLSEMRSHDPIYQTLLNRLSSEELFSIGHSIESSLVSCHLDGVPCNASNFTGFYDTSIGTCFTFVATVPFLQTWKTGPNHGLTLQLATNSWNYFVPNEAGFVITVHSPRGPAFVSEEGVYVPAERAAHIGVTKELFVDTASGDCIDSDDPGANYSSLNTFITGSSVPLYSQKACQKSCLQKTMITECQCCDLNLPCPLQLLPEARRNANSVYCNESQTLKASCHTSVLQSYFTNSLGCLSECKPACRSVRYPVDISYTTWPLTWTGGEFNENIPAPLSTGDKLLTTTEAPLNTTSTPNRTSLGTNAPPQAANNFTSRRRRKTSLVTRLQEENRDLREMQADVKVTVFFRDLRCHVTESFVIGDWVTLMADLGGIASLWLGLSVLGVLEIVHLLTEFGIIGYINVFRKKSKVTNVEELTSSS